MAVISRSPDAIQWGLKTTAEAWGPIALQSPLFDFDQTDYYEATMGSQLKKQLVAFEELIDPTELVQRKLQTNDWEAAYAQQAQDEIVRPLNLDPGYVTEAKLVLATTKDRDHRIYLDRGIYAECTLRFHGGQWCNQPWTYPDYQTPDYHQFLTECRHWLRAKYRSPAV